MRGKTAMIWFTWAMTMPFLNAVASTMVGVSSVFGPVYKLPCLSAACAATKATLGVKSIKYRANNSK